MNSTVGHSGTSTASSRRGNRYITAGRLRASGTTPRTPHRLRRVLDCLLILLVLLIVAGDPLTARAGSVASGGGVIPAAVRTAAFGGTANGALNSERVGAPPDGNTLAAVIAAENSALTPPLYFVDLPLISR
jgi:hypothetical protein